MRKLLLSMLAIASMVTVNAQTVLFYDGFEDYADFTITDFGDWKQFDLDGGQTWAVDGGTFPNQNYIGAGIIFNDTTADNIGMPAYAGQKGLYYFAAGANSTAYPNNDWTISPKISIVGVTTAKLELYAKAVQLFGPDQFKIGVSTTQDVAGMTYITPNHVKPTQDWKKYEFDLSDYVGQDVYIGIHCTTDDGLTLLLDEFKVVEGAVTPLDLPDCPTLVLPTNGATAVEYAGGVQFSWDAPAGDIIEYDFFLDGQLLGTTPYTDVSVTGFDSETTYAWSVIARNADGDSVNCAEFTFTTGVSPVSPYCGPLAFTGLFGDNVEPISRVAFAGIDNVTDATFNNSPAHEIFLDKIAEVNQGETYTITLEGYTGGSYTNNFAVFIDWDGNGVFDANETYTDAALSIANSTGTDGIQATYDITVPADAVLGQTRMRVKKIFGTTNLADPCLGASYGQAEEYTVNVSPTMSINDQFGKKFNAYPNPVHDVLNIDSATKVQSVTITDVTGKIMGTYKLEAAKSQINVSRLTPGVYILQVTTEDGKTHSSKIIKK